MTEERIKERAEELLQKYLFNPEKFVLRKEAEILIRTVAAEAREEGIEEMRIDPLMGSYTVLNLCEIKGIKYVKLSDVLEINEAEAARLREKGK